MKNLSFQTKTSQFILWAARLSLLLLTALGAQAQSLNISQEPTNVTAPAGSTVSFTVVAAGGTTPYAYKWYQGAVQVPGSLATLTLVNISDANAGNYTVVVTDHVGNTATSAPPAVLTVTHPPVITTQPESQVVNTGDDVFIYVGANGASLDYQWESNAVALPGETNFVIELNPVQDSDAALYSVVLTNTFGTATSSNASLVVLEPALTIPSPADSCTTVTLSAVISGSDPSLQYQWYFTTNMTPVGTNGPSLTLTNISFANAGYYTLTVSNSAGTFASASGTLTVTDPPPVVQTQNITVQLDASGNVTITPAQVDNGSYDNCGIASESLSTNSFTCANVGTNTVTLYVTDNSNQTAYATALVTVQDVVPPTAVFNTISVQLDATGNYTLTAANDNAITAGSSDACGIASTNITPSSFTFCDVGAKTVTLTLTDVNGNIVTTNGVVNVLAPVAAPAVVYVDASYSGCGPVTFPNVGGTGSHFIGYDAFATVQGGVNAVAPGGTVNVAAGTYNGSVSANKSVTLLGANQGAAACGPRVAESIINGGGGNAITVAASDVVIDGFNLTGVQGVQAVGYAAVIRNNLIGAAAAGINAESITTTVTNLVVENNCITLSTQVNGSTPTFGVLLAGVSGTQSPVIQGNGIQGAFYGYLLYGLNASVPTVVQGGTVTGAMQGVAVVNLNPVTLSSYGPSSFRLDSVSLSGFTGNWPSLPNNNIHAGVYIYSGGSSALDEVTGTLTNLTITGTDNLSPDSAGLDFADFSTGAGVRQQITVQNSVISTNSNRGIFVSGTNAVANVSGCSLIGNGFNPYGSGGNSGFGVIARNNSQVTVSQCFIANPATQTSYTVTAVESDANTAPMGPTLVVTDCSIVNNGNGNLAGQDSGTLNASGNWWGSTSDTAIAALMTGVVDFTPYLDSATDTDNVTPGFQGDFSTLHVTTLGAQTAGERVQEGHDLATGASPTVIVQAGSYSESVAISKTGFTLKSAQNAGVDARGARNAESIMTSTAAGGTIQISANNVTIDGMQTAGPGAAYGVNVSSSSANATVINTIMSGGAVGAGVFGTATARYDVASVPANTVGILVSGGSAAALLEYNSLTGDTEAGIKATLGATVDAGDCSGGDVTGLGTGSGLNGSSAGGNSLTGYGFDNSAPWAVENLNAGGSPAVLADQDSYGAVAGNILASLFSGNVLADQSGTLLLQSPSNLAFQCLSSVPSGATNLAGFMAQGGTASATVATVSFSDSVVSSTPNNRIVTRTYTVTDACSQANCVQTITVDDTIPPVVTTWPSPRTLDVNGACQVAVPDLTTNVMATDNCVGYHITQIPAAGTLVSLGTTNVLVVVSDNSTNSVSTNVLLTIIDTQPSPVATYVDAGYASLPSGTVVTWPAVGGTGPHYIGCDAFPTIQAGVNRVAASGTVNVAAGRYVEDVAINQPLALLGPNATNNPNLCARVAEAVIQPATNDPDMFIDSNPNNPYSPAAVILISLESSGVTVKGFTIDGYNPDLTGAFVSGTNYFNSAVGIGDYNGDNSIRIENNIIKNDAFAGVDLESDATGAPTTNSCIKDNLIENINYNTEGYGEGIYLQQNYYAEISGNTLSNVAIGISPQWFYSANPGDVKGQTICSNNVNASLFGIWVNLVYSSGSTFIISDNTSAFAPTNGSILYAPPEWDGVVISSIQDDVGVVASNNTIIGTPAPVGGYNAVGYNIWNTPTAAVVAISGGSISNANYGVWLNNYDLFGPGGSTRTTVSNVNISGSTLAGVYVQDDPRASTSGVVVQATVNGNSVISSSAPGVLGVWVQGTNAGATVINNTASITGNAVGVSVDTGVALLQNNDLTGNTVAGISATNGAIVDAGNCTGTNVTGLGISTGGNNLSYGFAGSPWAIINGNAGSPIVLADHDNFGAVAGNNIPGAFSGAVEYSQSPAVITAPTALSLTCASAVPAGVTDLASYNALGGYYSGSMASVSSSDVTNLSPGDYTNFLGSGVIYRTYSLTDGCGTVSTAVQTITVSDTIPPFFTVVPTNVIYPADMGVCSKANVTWVISASDNCGVASVVSTPPSGSTFGKGTTTVTTIATDYSGNTATNMFTVTVVDTQAPVVTVWPANATLDVNGQCEVTVPDLRPQIVATDNCDVPVYAQSPVAGTLVSLGMTNVLVTVSDLSGNSVSNNVVLTVVDTQPAPVATYVDTNYASLASGTVVTWPYTGGTGTHYVGCDAFGTIQAGINRVATNGTVNVAAGTYPELVTIGNALSLIGPNAGINPGTNARNPEAVIFEPGDNPGPGGDVIVTVANSTNVVISGFTIDGDNNQAVPGQINASEGVYTENSSCLIISNNILRNFEIAGLDADGEFGVQTNINVTQNLVTNVPGQTNVGYGYGILFENNSYGDITTNVTSGTRRGLQVDSNLTGPSNNVCIKGNQVDAGQVGIWINNSFQNTGGSVSIQDNVITSTGPSTILGALNPNYSGIFFSSLWNNTGSVTACSNSISGQFNYGILAWNNALNVTVQGGLITASNMQAGVLEEAVNYYGPVYTGGQGLLTLAGLTVSNAPVGVWIEDNGNGGSYPFVQASVQGTTITGTNSGIGVEVTGPLAEGVLSNASISANAVGVSVDTGVALLQNNDLTGNTVAGISATNGAIVDAGNCTGTNVTGLGISTGGNNLSYGFAGSPWAIINGNAGSPIVLADHDNFGAVAGNNIPGAFSGAVEYSQSPAVITAPTALSLTCASAVPAGVTDLASYNALGGYYSGSMASVSSSDVTNLSPGDYTNFLGSGVIYRTYSLTDGCGTVSTAVQTITVSDTIPPFFTVVPTNVIYPADMGVCSKANVTWVISASDNCGVASVVSTPPSGSTFGKGTTTVTTIATDYSGNTATNMFTVTVVDTQAPMISQCAPTRTIDANTNAQACLPNLTALVVATDNCDTPVITQIPAAGTLVGLGVHTVTLWASDTSGNSNSCTTTVTVLDVTPPTITCPADVTITLLQSKDPYATGTATATDAGASQEDQPIAITYNDNASLTNCDSTGTILRTWYAVDPSNNTNYCTQTITVVDTNAPFFVFVPADITTTNDPLLCSAVVDYANAKSEDLGYFEGFEETNFVTGTNDQFWGWNDYNSHLSRATNGTQGITADSGAAFGLIDSTVAAAGPDYSQSGVYTLLGGGNTPFTTGFRTALEVYVNLNDPAITGATPTTGYGWDLDTGSQTYDGANGGFGRDYIFHTAAYGPGGVVVAADNGSSDNGSERRNDLLSVPNHSVLTNSGWYKFEWNFRNTTNNVLAVDLNVRDAGGSLLFSQTLSDPSDAITNISGNPNYMWFNFVAADYLAIDNTVFERNVPVVPSQASATAYNVGTNTVTFTATDACGNSASTNFTVIVNDVEPPSANVPVNIVQTNDPGQCGALVSFTLPSQTDNCEVAGQVATPPSGSFFTVGTTPVTVVVTDIHGNMATNTFTVTVNDVEPPSANVPANIVQTNDLNECGALVYFTIPTNTDNCGVSNVVATPASGSFFTVGTTPVTVVVTDIHGNSNTNSFTVTVNDTQPPMVNCPADIVQGVDPGQLYATVTFTPTASDNCAVASVVATPPSGSHFGIGTNIVTVLATDIHSNTSTCSFTVQVVGLPQITQQPVSRTNNAGTTATFTVVATSPTPISYLWKKNGAGLSDIGNISGSATATLTVANVSDSDVACYSVCVSNLGGKVISSSATLTVIDPPVIVSITPVSQTNDASTTATFTVSATGTLPFSYQWTKITTNATNVLTDVGNILGSSSNVLTISNVLAADQAEYAVTVSNPAGSPTTNGTLFVIDPAILVQPAGVTTNQGGDAIFTVVAAGTASLSYQWQQDDVDLPGQTGSTLTITDAQDSDEGSYTVVVSNSVGQITSAPAMLALTHPPVIVTQPASRTNNLGTTATFTISVNGATPFTYQWEKGGISIPGATNRTLVLSSVSPADAAGYQVAVTNSDGYIISATATLTVIVPPAITSQPVGLTNNAGTTAVFSATASGTSPAYQWYMVTASATNALSDSNNISGSLSNVLTISNVLGADDANYYLVASNQAGVAASSNATLAVIDPIITNEPVSLTVNLGSPASFSVGAYGTSPQYQWSLNGTNIVGANAATYNIAAAADSDGGSYVVVVTNIYGMVTSAPPVTLTIIDPPVITSQPVSLTNNAGTTATFSVTATGTAPSYQWYFGALPIGGANSATLTLTNVQDTNGGGYSVVLSNAAGVVTSASATLSVIDAPAITSQPVSQTNNAGTTATFSVTATGTAPSYQWYFGASPIGGANSATLTLPNVQDASAGSYSVVLSNAAGVVTSTSATLTVIDAPVITSQPVSRTNNAGTTATFSVTATGTSPSYQWYFGASPIGGANSATLTLLNVQDANAGGYSVVLSNAAGVVTSASATLTVIDAPVITGEPVSLTNNASTTAIFTVTNTGTAPLVYQWYKITPTATNALSDSNNISGSASNVLTIANVLAADAASYSVTITNAAGATASSNALLVVIDPAILVQPAGSTNFDGSTVTFSVTAAGTPTLNYQWYQDNVALYGATNSSLTLADLADDDAGNYTVVVSNSVGSVTSSPATLLTVAPLITSQPSSVMVLEGGAANFSVSVDGETPFQYQWLFDGTNLSGATNRILALSNVQTNNSGNYQVVVANPIGVQTSQVAVLTVVVAPAIIVQPTNVIAVAGQTVDFSVTATGTPLSYQWHLNSTNLPLATNATLALNDVTTNNAGTYFVTVTNIGGSVSSSNVTLAVYATAAPELTLVLYTNGQATLELVGVPTYNYSIQASSNLVVWVPLVTNTSPFTFTDTNQVRYQFYRGHYLP